MLRGCDFFRLTIKSVILTGVVAREAGGNAVEGPQ